MPTRAPRRNSSANSRDLGETGRQAIARLVETAAKMQGLRLPEAGLFL